MVKRCASSNFTNWISPEISKENKKQKGPVLVVIEGKRYASMTEASIVIESKHLKTPVATIRRRCSNKGVKFQHWQFETLINISEADLSEAKRAEFR